MNAKGYSRRGIHWLGAGLGLAVAGYATVVGATWLRYGRRTRAAPDEADPTLDRFMPEYDVTERHHVRVAAPPEVTLAAAAEADLQQSVVVRAIFRARELVLGASPTGVARRPKGLLAEVESMGWRVLAETPGREVVVGAVTQPWLANVRFRGLGPDEFRAFHEPGYVKIAWTLRADPLGAGSVFRTETRVATTDATARRAFRWYWARFSPGIVLIRQFLLKHLKQDAERRVAPLAESKSSGPGTMEAMRSQARRRNTPS